MFSIYRTAALLEVEEVQKQTGLIITPVSRYLVATWLMFVGTAALFADIFAADLFCSTITTCVAPAAVRVVACVSFASVLAGAALAILIGWSVVKRHG